MKQRLTDLIILGPQGSGKGTQAKLLEEEFGFVVLGTGDLLREIAKKDTTLGRKINQLINVEGKLADDELISDVIKDKIANLGAGKRVILEGYPRTLRQYELMKEFWGELGRGDYKAILVELSEDEAIKRLATRLTCENCGAIYIAGKAPEKCSRCGGRLIERPDDRPEVIRKRLELFDKQTMPLARQLKTERKLIRIDGAPSIEEVHQEVLRKLKLGLTSATTPTAPRSPLLRLGPPQADFGGQVGQEGKPISLILLGDIAAGKGTQAKILAKKFRLKHIDVGVYSRRLWHSGRMARVKKGRLAPSDIIQKYLKSQITSLKSNEGVLIDGGKMPAEARLINGMLQKQKRKFLVIYLTIPRKEILKRLQIRLRKESRPDDTSQSLKNRIDYYKKIYSRTVKYWKSKGVLRIVNGNQPVGKVTRDIERIINSYFN